MNSLSTSELFVRCLSTIGCRRVYTLPADLSLPLLGAIEELGIEIVSVANEEAMVVAADIEAHLEGFSLLIATDGYSVSKLINGLIAARLRYSPLLVVVISQDLALENRSLLNCHPQPSRLGVMMHSIGLNCISVHHLSSVQSFFQAFTSPQRSQQPVVLNFTRGDVQNLRWDVETTLEQLAPLSASLASETAHQKLDELLNDFPDLILIFGNGINRHRSRLRGHSLNDSIAQHYLLLPSAKGCLVEDDPRCIGVFQGDYSNNSVLSAIYSTSTFLLVEVEDHELPASFWQPYAKSAYHGLQDQLVHKDKQVVLLSESNGLELEKETLRPVNWLSKLFQPSTIGQHEKIVISDSISNHTNDSTRYDQVVNLLNRQRTPMVLIADVGISCIPLFNWIVRGENVFVSNHVWANMGFSFSAGLAAAKIFPEQDLWIVCGDGSAVMAMQDMLMFVRESIAVKIIILDNHGYLTENLKTAGSFNQGFDIDWCLYAKSIGFGYAATVKTTESLNNVFQHFTETDAPQSLLSIEISPQSIPQQLNNLMTWDILRRTSL